ncbi:hypothetical protein [Flagellimonas allohymeniacidonis]|uniref:Uncharacterized protein n=1 Tax=Flagellimonas allohymeniacidonis TaxID=2517819 RepID=A0A4Q8QGW1_9FLAO|nr:hypothetical protein [Allomuricauda hymeniacidonis]TAI47629.1 hypothetical protein EW142_13275 [Allomuricauda hymeniacidonis]
MRHLLKVFVCLGLLFQCAETQSQELNKSSKKSDNRSSQGQVSSQEKINNLDARQYVEIFEIKGRKKINIWKYSQDSVNQQRKIIDTKSNIRIEFLREEISQNRDFKGNITIEGKIVSTQGGEDPVEVYPYSRIGQEKTKIGITNRPPHEIATIFVNLILECLKTEEKVSEAPIDDINNIRLLRRLESYIQDISDLTDDDGYDDDELDVFYYYYDDEELANESLYKRFMNLSKEFLVRNIAAESDFPPVFNDVRNLRKEDRISKKSFLSGLNEFQKTVKEKNDNKRDIVERTFRSEIKKFNSRLQIIIDYIDYFKSSGEQAEDAFLSTIQLDHIALDQIETNLKNINRQLSNYLNPSTNNNQVSAIEASVESFHFEGVREISRLTQIEGTDIEDLIEYHAQQSKKERQIIAKETSLSQDLIEIDKKDLIEKLALKASEIIYRDLNYATINLNKERAQEGDLLYLYLILEESQRRNNGNASEIVQKVLPIGTYEIRNTRWEVKIADSFLLVNRINEPSGDDADNLSPSNFKGAPGVSLLLTYRRDGRHNNRFINFLEPSIGVNVSYIDFSTEDDLEIGAGLVMGFFNNKIFVTSGINLNNTGRNETRPFYWGLGFSFANIVGKLSKKD